MILEISEIDTNLLFSPAATLEQDTRPADIYTFIPTNYPELAKQLTDFSNELHFRDDHRLVKNYINMDFLQFPFVTMYKRDKQVVGFATGHVRDCYPKNSVRLLNRFYHDKTYSRKKFTRELLRPSTFCCIQQQMITASNLGFDTGFISRELRAIKFFSRFIKELDKRGTHSWEYKEGPFLVSPDAQDIKSWQSLALVEFKKTHHNFWSHWKCK